MTWRPQILKDTEAEIVVGMGIGSRLVGKGAAILIALVFLSAEVEYIDTYGWVIDEDIFAETAIFLAQVAIIGWLWALMDGPTRIELNRPTGFITVTHYLWGAKITSVSGWVTQPAKRTRGISHPAPSEQRFARPAAGQPDEADLWESRDQGCDEADHRCSG